jgi:sugar lactone lactonase YvrE
LKAACDRSLTMRPTLALVALTLLLTGCSGGEGGAPDGTTTTSTAGPIEDPIPVTQSYAGTMAAPEFPDGLDWINTNPLRLADLTGKIVLLDFWTYGCINCIHVIPDLKRLEAEYPDELVVIGVHSAKFTHEGETENIRQIVQRYEVDHPVVNDRDFAIWQSWGTQAWPTMALIDPAGNVVGMHAGEGFYEVAQPVIESLLLEFSDQIDRSPLPVNPERATAANTALSYPGNVAVGDGLLYISDTGHHRVVAADPETGEVVAVYGSGAPGFESGPALEAQFDSPQGLAFDPVSGTLYVADTNNHAIRTIDVGSGEVATLTGTGALGWPPAASLLDSARLNSPWGLALHQGDLWIGMAGFHQIWVADLDGGTVSPAVGSGREGVANGGLATAELAQPSGLAFDAGGRLYFADAESSSIRFADALLPDGQTGILSGSNVNLFDFGDVDGIGTEARLQHPLGIVWDPASGDLLVADTYNSKLKRIDPDTGETTTYLGEGRGWADGPSPRFYEPGGLAISGPTLFVADTNNHVVRTVDLETDSVATLVLHGMERFAPPPNAADYPGTVVELSPLALASGDGIIRLAIELPDGYKVNEDAPSSVSLSATGVSVTFANGAEQSLTGATLPIDLAITFEAGSGVITADVTLLYCRNDSAGLCIIEQVRFRQPVTVGASGDSEIVLPHRVEVPEF